MDRDTKSNLVFVGIIAAIVGGLMFGWSDIQWFRFDTAVRVLLSTEGIGTHASPEIIGSVKNQVTTKAAEFGYHTVDVEVRMERRASSLGTTFWYVVVDAKQGKRSSNREIQLDREYEREDIERLRDEYGVKLVGWGD